MSGHWNFCQLTVIPWSFSNCAMTCFQVSYCWPGLV